MMPWQRRNRRFKEPLLRRALGFLAKSVKLILVGALLPALAYSGWLIYREAITTPYLSIRAINVSGGARVTKEEVIELSNIRKGQNILSFSAADAVLNVKRNPWIETVEIRRGIPDTVNLVIKERLPVALIKMDELYVMDRSGVVFKKLSAGDTGLDLPVVTGLTRDILRQESALLEAGAIEILRLLEARQGFNLKDVSEIHVDPLYGVTLVTLHDGVRLNLFDRGFEEKLLAFERIRRSMGGTLSGVESMDLNGANEAVVRFNVNVLKEGGAV
ncbi:MAG: FtsQ-type POTRA domain-containing protein [Deltaproteobacteria bacterium]|nr:FtsQ-type POTRA domain-containing protein [Deltaproteobacteria bacterium]